jgi:phage-related protein
MPLTLTLPVTPSQSGYQEQTAFRVQTARFGDGYEQRVADGINTVSKTVSLTCSVLTTAEKNTLLDFLTARGGWDSFYYTLPSEASPRLWVCQEPVSVAGTQATLWDVTFTLREVFDLA